QCTWCRTDVAYEQQAFKDIIIDPGFPTLPATWTLDFVATSEGFYSFIENRYIYQYRDHLGNARVSYAKNSEGAVEITDTNNYYAFGLNHIGGLKGNLGGYQNYKYNGKELQETGMYDYGARFYMPDIGRWGVVDPLAEKYQPFNGYNYVLNNPISNIDPDGMEVKHDYQILKNGDVKLIKETQEKSDTLYASNDKGEVDKSKGSVTVKKAEVEDSTIISDLATNRKEEFGFGSSDLRLATTSNRTDALDVFQFAALNSTNEWSIQSNTINGKNEYALGTQLHPRLSPNYLAFDKLGYSSKTLNWDMHSHGTYLGTNGPSSGDTGHALTNSAVRFLFRTNGNDRGKVYPYGKSFDNNNLFRQRRYDDMKQKKFSNDLINFK
ncbi:RHS repeat-associated core domain-containing protein, partial [Chryseobacterium elymi]|uniref:RHS repeat-associated core domain-containing protein n=1 Tax=Chryseobacterium elymi TaxID=395936 RepID=UPI0029394B21